MKIKIKDIPDITYTVTAIVSETVQSEKLLGGSQIKAVVYCKDKERKPHKFLMEDIEIYQD